MSSWINVTPKLRAGLVLINAVDPAKLRLLLNRIVSRMQQDFKGKSVPCMFTEEEEAKLEKSLSLESKDVQLVIDTAFVILQQAAYHIVKPELLHNELVGLQIEQERAAVIASLWSSNAASIVENLKHQSVLPNQLKDFSWMVMVETSSDVETKLKEPVALLELLMKSSESDPKIQLKMSHKDLQMLYQKLEHVQSQLDSLK